jgi:hypothetical protein
VPFTFQSASLTSAWNDNLVLQITGYLKGRLVDSRKVVLNPSGPTNVDLNFQGVDTVRLASSGGTLDPAFAPYGSGPQFVLDNVAVDVPGANLLPPNVPEPPGLVVGALITATWWFLQRGRRLRRAA